MAYFRFFHASDIHLDSPLMGLAGQEGDVAERIHTATREALVQLVDLTIEEMVDFLTLERSKQQVANNLMGFKLRNRLVEVDMDGTPVTGKKEDFVVLPDNIDKVREYILSSVS